MSTSAELGKERAFKDIYFLKLEEDIKNDRF